MRRTHLASFLRAGSDELRRGGLRRLIAALAWRLSPARRLSRLRRREDGFAFDGMGYDTSRIASLDDLRILGGGGPGDGVPYEATPTYVFEAALAMLEMRVDGASFVDLGAGKGRILLLAAERPFARIIGVEYAEQLCTIAAANLARRVERLGPDPRIDVQCGDAADFVFPTGPLIVFLYNPFGAETMRAVAARLHSTWRDDPRPIRLLYLNPRHTAELHAAGFRLSAKSPDFAISLYEPV
jgi:SAM-dependent methyltransferase